MDEYVKEINFSSPYNVTNKLKRLFWNICWTMLAKPLPRNVGRRWKIFLLRCWGAKIDITATVYSSVKIFMPWNLIMEEYACLASNVICYNAAPIIIKAYATVSQRCYLCTASHNIYSHNHEQIEKPIIIGKMAWIAAEAFVGPGVKMGEGAVAGARAVVVKDVDDWNVVGGNPAKFIKFRSMQ